METGFNTEEQIMPIMLLLCLEQHEHILKNRTKHDANLLNYTLRIYCTVEVSFKKTFHDVTKTDICYMF